MAQTPAEKPAETVPVSQAGEAPTPSWDTKGGGVRRADALPREFGDYLLEEEIARGGMGVVYRAVQRKLNRTVAVKMILSGKLASEEEVQRFYAEAESAAHLDHPGIVPIYEVNEVEGQPFFSMAYIDGESLAARLKRGPLSPGEAAEIAQSVAEAVAYAHAQGIIHRDLKPSNILMTKEGRPRVTDFGLAKTVEGDGGLTATGQVLGTPGYMPPEQAQGKAQAVGPHSDVYALGAVLYCLLTARPPFQAATTIETLQQVIDRPPASPRLLNPAVDVDLETICLKCLEKDPRDRIASAAELTEELGRYLRGEPIRSRRVGPLTKAWRWAKRNWATAALASLAPVVIAVFAIAAFVFRFSAESRELARQIQAFEARLDQIEPTAEYLVAAEALADAIAAIAPEEGRGLSRRLNDRWLAAVEQSIRRLRLAPDDVARIEAAIRLLEERRSPEAKRLGELLARRKATWQPALSLRAPFDELGAAFPPGIVERHGPLLLSRVAAFAAPGGKKTPAVALVPTRVVCRSRSELEVEFDASWEQTPALGLCLNRGDDQGYEFLLFPQGHGATRGDEATGAEQSPGPLTFAAARQRGGEALFEIRRQGAPVQRHREELAGIPSGPLTLRARRVGGELEFQIGGRTPIYFYDPFPLRGAQRGVYALRWPPGVGLRRLEAREELLDAASPLEQADAAYEDGRYNEALDLYAQQALLAAEPAFKQEAEFKRGQCLIQLNRQDEAAQVFLRLMNEDGARWPAQAGVQAWLAYLQQGRTDEAEGVYQLLASRFRFEQLALMIPAAVRQEIVQSYASALNSVGDVLSFDPGRIRDAERAAAIDRLLSYDGRGQLEVQLQLTRVYRFAENYPAALSLLRPLATDNNLDSNVWRNYLRVLRRLGRYDEALTECRRYLQNAEGKPFALSHALLNRAFAHAARKEWELAEAATLRAMRLQRDPERFGNADFANWALIAGFLCWDRGDEAGAIALWGAGYEKGRNAFERMDNSHAVRLNYMILGALSGRLSDDDAQAFFHTILRGESNAILNVGARLVGGETFAGIARKMWTTPRGRAAAREIAFDTYSMRQRALIPFALAVSQYLSEAAFGGRVSQPQEEILHQAASLGVSQAVEQGTIHAAQIIQLGLAWEGTASLLGWQGVAPTLDPKLRRYAAYILGHRYVRLNNLPQAERFLQQALEESPPDSRLARLAADDLRLLRERRARLEFVWEEGVGEAPSPVEIVVRQNGVEAARLTVAGPTQIDIAPGTYEFAPAAPHEDLRLSPTAAALLAADTATVALTPRWPAGSAPHRLPGLLPRPADFAHLGRWQLVPRDTLTHVHDLAFQPGGELLAASGSWHDALVRLYDRDLNCVAVLPGGVNPAALSWSPEGRLLAVAGHGPIADVWDVASRRLALRLADHSSVFCVAWSPQGDLVATGDNLGAVRIWSSDGALVHEATAPVRVVHRLAWRPDGGELALAVGGPPRLYRWTPGAEASQPLPGALDETCLALAFSPDGRYLAACHRRGVEVWDWSAQERSHFFPAPREFGSGFAWAADGTSFWLRDRDRLLRFRLDGAEREPVEEIVISGDGPVAYDSQRRLLATTQRRRLLTTYGNDGRLAAQGAETNLLHCYCAAFHPSGARFAAAFNDGKVRLLDADGRLIRDWDAHTGPAYAVDWSADGKVLASAGHDGKVRLWSGEDYAPIRALDGHAGPVTKITFHPGVQILATTGNDNTVRLWSAEGQALAVSPEEADRQHAFVALAWSAEGSRLAAATAAGEVFLWDERGALVHRFQAPERIASLSWSRDGARLSLAVRSALHFFTADGQPEGQLQAPFHWTRGHAWLSDARVAVVRDNGEVWLLDAQGERLEQGSLDDSRLSHVAFDTPRNRMIALGQHGEATLWDLGALRPRFTVLATPEQTYTFDGAGRLRNDDVTDVSPFAYLVETPTGFQTLSQAEFLRHVGEDSLPRN